MCIMVYVKMEISYFYPQLFQVAMPPCNCLKGSLFLYAASLPKAGNIGYVVPCAVLHPH